jgi:hypothetical protein
MNEDPHAKYFEALSAQVAGHVAKRLQQIVTDSEIVLLPTGPESRLIHAWTPLLDVLREVDAHTLPPDTGDGGVGGSAYDLLVMVMTDVAMEMEAEAYARALHDLRAAQAEKGAP